MNLIDLIEYINSTDIDIPTTHDLYADWSTK